MSRDDGKKEKAGGLIGGIKVIGVGGGGGNAVSRMSRDFIRGVEFIAVNTDHQDLDHCQARRKIYIGKNLTRGLGAGMNPDLGRQSAEENRSEIAEALRDADLVFIAAGLGGGTGTGASPIIAEVAKQAGALTVAVVTKPFLFEGSQRERIAQEGLLKLKEKVDALIVVPNDRIFTIISKDTPIAKAFEAIDNVLKNALRGIVELIVTPGLINVDFADIRAIIQDAGTALVGVGVAAGPERAVNAVNQALNSPLLEVSAEGARGVLLGISGRDLKMNEIKDAAKLVAQTADPGAKIIFGAYHDRTMKENQFKVTLIATGFNETQSQTSLFTDPFAKKDQLLAGSPAADSRFAPMDDKEFAPRDRGGADDIKNHFSDDDVSDSLLRPATGPANRSLGSSGTSSFKKPEPEKKKESDVWDIPTFLRRKKK